MLDYCQDAKKPDYAATIAYR